MGTQTLDPRLVVSLQTTAAEIFETMVFLKPLSITTLAETSSLFHDEVIGLLGFTGTRSGTFIVRTTSALAMTIAAKMLMTEPAKLSGFNDAADAFGEVVNMLGGNFKNAWVATGKRMDLSVPTVIHNGDVKVNSSQDGAVRSGVRVELPGGSLHIGVHFNH